MELKLYESDIHISDNHLKPLATCGEVDVGLTAQTVHQCYVSALQHAFHFGYMNDQMRILSDSAGKIRRAGMRAITEKFCGMTAHEKMTFLAALRSQRERMAVLGVGKDKAPLPFLQ